ncbi:MAG: argininosuccinate synthase [Lachnospiraceae bacterium]|jgi:argininosuccinate synthase|nr:hypothetical protein [Lachnospiraceae bacterium]MCX4299273.1 argininosuccinate synthase [Lachnospiraceae bacterium]
MEERNKCIAIAFSGGLDSSVVPVLLHEFYGYSYRDMISVLFDVGQDEKEIEIAERNCKKLRVQFVRIDAKEHFVRDFVTWNVIANSNRNGYPLGTAMTRQMIAYELGAYCMQNGINKVAHGCSEKGNDVRRFYNIFNIYYPLVQLVAPIVDYSMNRKQERELAKKYCLYVEEGLSHDVNLWSHSIGSGEYVKIGDCIPEQKFKWVKKNKERRTVLCQVDFQNGRMLKINGNSKLNEEISRLNEKLGENGFGYHETVEEMMTGMKSIEIYECPAADIIQIAHRMFEQFVYSKKVLMEKMLLEFEYTELTYHGNWFSKRAEEIRKQMDILQERVTGSIELEYGKRGIRICSFCSEYSLYNEKERTLEE